jgi:anti-sigma factor RsiW
MKPDRHHHDPHCLALFEKLSQYLDDELDRAACREIERHMHDCQACRNCLETLRRTTQICRQFDEREVPEAFSRHLRRALQSLSQP